MVGHIGVLEEFKQLKAPRRHWLASRLSMCSGRDSHLLLGHTPIMIHFDIEKYAYLFENI